MKFVVAVILAVSVSSVSMGQEYEMKEVTPEVMQSIKRNTERLIPALRTELSRQDFSKDQIEFSLDTFRIEKIASGRMEIDYSTIGINETIKQSVASYEKLINRYIARLSNHLKPVDKKILTISQQNWMAYRNSESNLLRKLSDEEYSGGGTIQSINYSEAVLQMVKQRAIQVFNHYDGVMKD